MCATKQLIIGWIIGIITTYFGAWLNNRYAILRNRQNEFRQAAKKFRSAFKETLTYLCGDPVFEDDLDNKITHIGQFLRETYPALLSAKMDFILHFGWLRRFSFNRAWEKYIYPQKKKKDREYGFEFDNYSKMPRAEAKKLALSKIEKILSYAKL